jgi:hypothetical protein
VQDDRPTNVSQHESLARHPVRAAEQEAEHLRKIADEGENPRTPAILVGTVLLFIVPIVALLIALAFTVAHFVG